MHLRHSLVLLWIIGILSFLPTGHALPYPRQTQETIKKQWVLKLQDKNPSSHSLTFMEDQAAAFAQVSSTKFLGQVGNLVGTFLYESTSADSAIPNAEIPEDSRKLRVQGQQQQQQQPLDSTSDTHILKLQASSFFEAQDLELIELEDQTPRKRHRRKPVSIDAEDAVVTTPSLPPPSSPSSRRNRKSIISEQIPVPENTQPHGIPHSTSVTQDPSEGMNVMGWNDPNFHKQWNLYNDGADGRIKGNDINVVPVWKRGINGTGVTVVILDDGVDFRHKDFEGTRWSAESSFDFSTKSPEPLPVDQEDIHGTRCAGQVAAAPNNKMCGVGVAFGATIAGERLLTHTTTDAIEAQALNFKSQINDIYSSSWGPDDDGESVDGPGKLSLAALKAGVETGRKGRGSIFVFASGNGGNEGDNCNFDGYANSIYTVAVGAINHKGVMPSYGELCAAHLAVTYSGGAGQGIWTTDVNGTCTGVHSGTSATAPIASGIIALMLSTNPDLGWRDIQDLIVKNSIPTDPKDPSWKRNGAGLLVSHKYGFGKLDATKLVEAAESKKKQHHNNNNNLLPSQQLHISKKMPINKPIPNPQTSDFNTPTFKSTIEITPQDLLDDHDHHNNSNSSTSSSTSSSSKSSFSLLEHVQVKIHLLHPSRRHLTILLTSPAGTKSFLATPRPYDMSTDGFDPWTFMTVHSWGESPLGVWTLEVYTEQSILDYPIDGNKNSKKDGGGGGGGEMESIYFAQEDQFYDWTLELYGTCHEWDVVLDQEGNRVCGPKKQVVNGSSSSSSSSSSSNSWQSILCERGIMYLLGASFGVLMAVRSMLAIKLYQPVKTKLQ
ncbi:peptidase S8/S53 domain-containing protein [Obelidium mucronatum]|nr:peptidase S8/S53 domain-containing protein [Obelidium mucronatum]